jgi:DNA-binding transcriptional ArsR family regulator
MNAQSFMYHRQMGHARQGTLTGSDIDLPVAQQVAQTMQALATPSRVLILARLLDGPCSVTELAEAVSMEQSAVSHQLRLLRHLQLVVSERNGRNVLYALHDTHVGVLLQEAVGHHEHLRLDSPKRRAVRAARQKTAAR